MESERPQKRLSKWGIVFPIVLICVVRVFQSYLAAQGREDLADFIGIGVFAVPLLGFILLLYLWAFLGTPPIDPLTREKMDIIEVLIDECLKEKNLSMTNVSKKELLDCIQKKVIEKGTFHVTYFHAKKYLEEVYSAESADTLSK